MPSVGSKKFPYTTKGKAAAKKHAAKSGKKIKSSSRSKRKKAYA
jgi:hypothetical protein|tara:strand:+ start:1174 stop:1305 length:132 start_codon:yes stop_codon:yes gene_type:complete